MNENLFILLYCLIATLSVSLILPLEYAVYQQSGYDENKLISCYIKQKTIIKSMLLSVILCLFNILFGVFGIFNYISISVIAVFCCFFVFFANKNVKIIKKVVITPRFLRLTGFSFILTFLLEILVCYAFRLVFDVYYACGIGAFIILAYCHTLGVSKKVNMPFDRLNYVLSINKCKKKLAKKNDLIKIGITGSCGKTSVKNILAAMLSVDYKVYATPKSYNTPLGICKSVSKMNDDTEVFIAEMGARNKGDIKELTNIVKPEIGVITGVTEQHLETFGSLENIKDTKFELIDGLCENGYAVFSADTIGSTELYERAKVNKCLVGINGLNVKAENIVISSCQTSFDLILKDVRFPVVTKLLGRHSVTDICLASAVALYLGVKPHRIADCVFTLKPTEHRAEVFVTESGVTVIDDGYNANILGIESDAEILKTFNGKKFAVVSGIVEGGKREEELNKNVGKILSECVDVIIAVGKNADAVLSGTVDIKGLEKHYAKNLCEAENILKNMIKSGNMVIFINDLPDSYKV
ncbi:MAG: UDP-N-acetylmuramoyl-tripeptide--D-alanyl-D-alanine ligase [Clostridia bacterium]|nr:UDP-N-acetylmuramoyl-tripeptide--D-alanyl-D-alanine ligase [Clostridia bacterium]